MLERLEKRATKMLPKLKNISYEKKRIWIKNTRKQEIER